MTQAQANECRNRSYQVPEPGPEHTSGKSIVPQGSEATLRYEYFFRGMIPAGTRVRVVTYVNAGFRGIEGWVTLLDGPRQGERVTVCAGNLEAAS